MSASHLRRYTYSCMCTYVHVYMHVHLCMYVTCTYSCANIGYSHPSFIGIRSFMHGQGIVSINLMGGFALSLHNTSHTFSSCLSINKDCYRDL